MVSVLHKKKKKLQCNVEKLKYKLLEVMQPMILVDKKKKKGGGGTVLGGGGVL